MSTKSDTPVASAETTRTRATGLNAERNAVPSTSSYRELHDRVAARDGAAERLAALRRDTLIEIGLHQPLPLSAGYLVPRADPDQK